MKVAVLYCGQPRNFSQQIYENHFKHIFSQYDCDVYAHFWFDETQQYESYATWFDKKTLHVRPDIQDAFQKLCNPKSIVFEKPLDKSVCGDMTQYSRTSAYGVVYNLHSMYSSLKKAFSLIQNIDEYDFFIRLRTDMVVHSMKRLYDKDVIYCVKYHDQENKGIDNAIWCSPVKYAERMFSIIDNLYDLYNSGTHMNDEQMFYSHIQKEGFLDKIQFGTIQYEIQRQ